MIESKKPRYQKSNVDVPRQDCTLHRLEGLIP